MKLVFDNIVYSLQRSGGVSRFWSKITAPYLDNARFIERNDACQNLYRRELHLRHVENDHTLPRLLSRYLNFGRDMGGQRHVFHSSYYRVNRVATAVNVTTVHDLIYELFGGRFPGSALHIAQKRKSLAAAACIVCVSENTRADLYRFYPETRHQRVLVIPNGVDMPTGGQPELSEDNLVRSEAAQGPFFLYVGHRGSCKGFDRVYEALKHLGRPWRCIVVGDPLNADESSAIALAGLAGRVVPVGRVTDSELTFLYGHAAFFFFPSLYEGFGIPPLEAMQQGCPVLASDRSSIPEVVGNAGILFNPDDHSSLHSGLDSITQTATRSELIHLGIHRANQFSWQAAADQYAKLYMELLDGCD